MKNTMSPNKHCFWYASALLKRRTSPHNAIIPLLPTHTLFCCIYFIIFFTFVRYNLSYKSKQTFFRNTWLIIVSYKLPSFSLFSIKILYFPICKNYFSFFIGHKFYNRLDSYPINSFMMPFNFHFRSAFCYSRTCSIH